MLRHQGRGWYDSSLPARIYVAAQYANGPLCFALLLIPSGSIMIGTSSGGAIRTVGSVVLGIGLTLLLIAVALYIAVGYLAKKKEDEIKQQEQSGQYPINEVPVQPLPASAYPHQQAPQDVYPTASVPIQSYPGNNYPPESLSQCPPQPANYNPPTSSCVPPSRYPSPPQAYSQSINPPQAIHSENLQPTIAGYKPISE